MDYKLLNRLQRQRMKQIINNDFQMEWENPEFMDTLIGELPSVRHTQVDNKVLSEIHDLNKLLDSYNAFSTNKEKFIQEVKNAVDNIHRKEKNWYGLNIYEVEECIRQHKFCLISGEGGIGKSYFIMCLEEKLNQKDIPHLCLYGKFEKDIKNISIEEIIKDCTEGFILIVDALNEMSDSGQIDLLQLLIDLKKYSNIRIIVTYRTNALDTNILDKYKEITSTEYSFPGVSFDSALETILKSSVPDVYKYEDILYSNNALLLSMLCYVLENTKLIDETENSIASVTFILEQYIKKFVEKTFKDVCKGVDIWKDTKRVAKWMYKQEKRDIDEHSLISIVKTGRIFLQVMIQSGFMGTYEFDGERHVYFLVDSLSDYLPARSLFEDISGRTFEEQVEVINRKVGKLYNMEEAVIIAIFDNLAPNYEYIKELLQATQLFEDLQYETLVKINFRKGSIEKFLDIFSLSEPNNLIGVFGGYTDKPFNCTNYLNNYYRSQDQQNMDLSSALSGYHFLGTIKKRLKNILYFITLNNRSDRRIEEAFYFSIWCCAAPNKDVRCLAMKLLYEILIKEPKYQKILIKEYKDFTDLYIKEAIIYILANCQKNNTEICNFFRLIIAGEEYVTAKSIKNIATYSNEPYGYINWDRKNLYSYNSEAFVSDFLDEVLLRVDLMNKNFLPFRYWSKYNIDMYPKFSSRDRHEIIVINKYLQENYSCVEDGYCNGLMSFESYIKDEIGDNACFETLDMNSFFSSYESVLIHIFELYQVDVDAKDQYMREGDFHNSIFMKCVDIATGIYYGSLMCNYYTNQFATYNNHQDSIGYEVYDPIEYGEEVLITAPIPTHQGFIEKLGDMVLDYLDIPMEKDIIWVRDVSITRKNVLSLLNIVPVKNIEWVLLAGRVSLHESDKHGTKWKDTYDVWCCTSEEETILDDGNARYLTIELEDYVGNLSDYTSYKSRPWLCKNIKNIKHGSYVFEETSLVLPPAEIISFFQLRPNVANMSWITQDDEKVIICNNNKNSYYIDHIGGTIFIRKDYLDKFLATNTLKYFAFAERFIPETGYADETSLHFEIQDGKIKKEISNYNGRRHWNSGSNPLCDKCPHGFNRQDSENEGA